MKYLLLIYGNPRRWEHPIFMHPDETLSESERAAMAAADDALLREIAESGELITAQPLAAPAAARTVRVRKRNVLVTDGPFAEAKEQLAGYFLLDCASLERALDIAARFPDAQFWGVEVRPIDET